MAGGSTAKPFFVGEIVRQPPEALDAFVAVAQAGNEFVYCEAPSPIRDETWLRAGALARLGLVRTHDRRRPGGGRQWYLVRTRKPLPKDVSPQEKVLNDAATAAIFVQLKREANFSLPCSTDAALARLTGLNTRNQAQHRVQELIRAELIESQIAYEGGVYLDFIRAKAVSAPELGLPVAIGDVHPLLHRHQPCWSNGWSRAAAARCSPISGSARR
jgi:hypothetical protein